MPAAQEIVQVASGILIWQLYDGAVKADLFSTALDTPTGRYLVDPVQLEADALESLAAQVQVAGIVVTNENHERSSRTLAKHFSVPIYAGEGAETAVNVEQVAQLRDQQQIEPGLTAVGIAGAPAGEVALHYEANDGTFVVGDALINFEPYGFALLPGKYCRDFKQMRQSLSKLLDYRFDRMLFAHGTPILSGARAKLERLLGTR